MRTHQKWLIGLLSLSMFACGEPSFIGNSGTLPIESGYLNFYIEDFNNVITGGGNTTAVTIDGNPALTTPESFILHWDITYGSPVDVTIQVRDTTAADPVNLFPTTNCSAQSTVCQYTGQTQCTYDNTAPESVTCDIASVFPANLSTLDLANPVYITFKACASAGNCASAPSIKVQFL